MLNSTAKVCIDRAVMLTAAPASQAGESVLFVQCFTPQNNTVKLPRCNIELLQHCVERRVSGSVCNMSRQSRELEPVIQLCKLLTQPTLAAQAALIQV